MAQWAKAFVAMPEEPRGGGRELTPGSCSVISTCTVTTNANK